MSATLTEHAARHGGGIDDDLRGHVARHAHDYCRRCATGDTTAPAKCPPCVAEVQRVRDEMRADIEAAIPTMAWMRAGIDDAGRTDTSGWGW